MKRLSVILFCSVLLCLSCSSYLRYYPYSFHPEPDRKVTKVVLAPLNLFFPKPSQIGNSGSAVHASIAAYLTEHGVRVEPSETTKDMWEEEKRRSGGVYNPADGTLDEKKFGATARNAVVRMCNVCSADAVIFPEIILRTATLDRNLIYWDGTVQYIEKESGGYVDPFTETFSGNSNALSLRIFIIGKDGHLILRNIAGIESLYKAAWDGLNRKWVFRKEMLADSGKIKKAVAISLHPFIFNPDYPRNPSFSKE